jgi:hypothetical protein
VVPSCRERIFCIEQIRAQSIITAPAACCLLTILCVWDSAVDLQNQHPSRELGIVPCRGATLQIEAGSRSPVFVFLSRISDYSKHLKVVLKGKYVHLDQNECQKFCSRTDDDPFFVLTETKLSICYIPVWARYSPLLTRVKAHAITLSP